MPINQVYSYFSINSTNCIAILGQDKTGLAKHK